MVEATWDEDVVASWVKAYVISYVSLHVMSESYVLVYLRSRFQDSSCAFHTSSVCWSAALDAVCVLC